MENLVFTVKGMHCMSCEKIIKMELEDLEGVKEIKIDHKTGQGSLKFDTQSISQDQIIKTINDAGYEANAI